MIKIALAQINPTVGDIAGNAEKILRAYQDAAKQGAELVVAPELALIGYAPEDLVLMPAFRIRAMETAQELATKTAGGPALIFGSLWQEAGKIYNAALLADGGKIIHVQTKSALPNYGVFDEKRIFTAGDGPRVASWSGKKIGLLVCEDIWHPSCAQALKDQGAQIIIVINASPFEAGKLARRYKIATTAITRAGLPLVYVNLVGGQDDIVFDGGSFAMDAGGKITTQFPTFQEGVFMCHPAGHKVSAQDPVQSLRSSQDDIWQAMTLALRDYVRKNGFSGVVLGLSGGIDSAISAAVAVDSLGAENVVGVLLPSPYTSSDSNEDALASAKLLGIKTDMIPITPLMETAKTTLDPLFQKSPAADGWMEDPSIGGNLQARIRGQILMAISNQSGRMLLSTSNKSELAVGYSTLYGDSCGAYCVLKDLYKTQVFALARWRNAQSKVIPERSISKAPTAELKPDQKDEDQLPPYAVLDAILEKHIELRQSAPEIVAQGFDKTVVEKIIRLVRLSEYKRRQFCPGVKLSPMLFGKDRRYPLTNGF